METTGMELLKPAAKAAVFVALLAAGIGAGSLVGGTVVAVSAIPQDDSNCESNHCGRINVKWWFDRNACLPNGDGEMSCNAIDEHGNCESLACQA